MFRHFISRHFIFREQIVKKIFSLTTPRLTCVAGIDSLLRAALTSPAALAKNLSVAVPDAWPPEHIDDDAIRWMLKLSDQMPADCFWGMYFIVLQEPFNAPEPTLIGTCGYKGPPDKDGQVEIGYSLLGAFQRCGYASEAAMALIKNAYQNGARNVIAETLPHLTPSRRVMEKCGMVFVGDGAGAGAEAGVIRYAHVRERQGVAD